MMDVIAHIPRSDNIEVITSVHLVAETQSAACKNIMKYLGHWRIRYLGHGYFNYTPQNIDAKVKDSKFV